jgi:hypothetical protein
MRRFPTLFLAFLLGAGCQQPRGTTGSPDSGSDQDSGVDTNDAGSPDANDLPSNVYPAFKLDVPQVESLHGRVLSAPTVVPVFFANDTSTTTIQKVTQFLGLVGSSSYWSGAVGEYGVGPLTATAAYMSTDKPSGTIQDSDIQNWILNKIATDPDFPQPDENTIYAMHYPSGVTIELQGGFGQGTSQSCRDFGGYHSDITLPVTATAGDAADGGTFTVNPNGASYGSYAVIPRCGSFGPLSGVDAVTGTESHELAEASTDPYPNLDPAYGQIDEKHIFWEFVIGGGEVGDMCAQNPGAFTKFQGLAFTVQRIWSNKNAREGHDPCQPVLPGEVYFNSMPVLSDTTTLNIGQQVTFESVNVAVGSSITIDLDLFSDSDTGAIDSGGSGDWQVQVQDLNQLMGGRPSVDYSLSPLSGRNGNQLQLTVSPKAASQYGANAFLVTSTLGNYTNLWVGAVGQ